MSKTKILLSSLLVVSFVICGVVLFEGYKEFQNKDTVNTLNKVKTDLNNGKYKEAEKLLSSLKSNNLFGDSLYSTEETALGNYRLNSNSYNQAINYMNNSNYAEALKTLKGIDTTNSYLKGKVTGALDYCNINYTKQLYNKGLEDLKNKDVKGVKSVYSTMDSIYPDSAFTKQLYDYMTGKAQATTSSYNIQISNPNSEGFTPISLDGQPTSSVNSGTGSSNVAVQESDNVQPKQTVTTTTTTTNTVNSPATSVEYTPSSSTKSSVSTYINNAEKNVSNSISTTYSSATQNKQDAQRTAQSNQGSNSYEKSCNQVDQNSNSLTSTSYSNN